MLYIKILAQVIIGASGLIAVLLDYKWHDKRKKIFKTLRNAVTILLLLSLVAGIFITINDEKGKNTEIDLLQTKLDGVQKNLSAIKSNGDKLNEQITPFLEIAIKKYPDLSTDAALNKLEQDINMLDSKTSNLQNSEYSRKIKEDELEKLKHTPPNIVGTLKMDDKRNIYLGIQFLNKVPIKFTYTLIHSKGATILSTTNSGATEIFPPVDNKMIIMKNDFNFSAHIPKQEESRIKLQITYESIYLPEIQDPHLIRQITKNFLIDPIRNVLTEENK